MIPSPAPRLPALARTAPTARPALTLPTDGETTMSDPTDTLRARVEQTQALAAAATPGPWGIMGGHNDYWIQAFDGGRVDGWPTGQKIVQLETWEPATKQGDAKLMAAAPDLVGLVTDLWAAYTAACDRADGRDRLEADVRRLTAECDEALALFARLRGWVEAPVVADGRGLVWCTFDVGDWTLNLPGAEGYARSAYVARPELALAYASCGAASPRAMKCADLPAACRQIAEWARADGHTVPPHPLGWDVGVSDG